MIELAKSRSSKSRANLADWLATHDPGLFLKRATVITLGSYKGLFGFASSSPTGTTGPNFGP